jgi:hypothetical protein
MTISSRWMRRSFSAVVCVTLVMLGRAFPAAASLGGDVSTVQADRVHMQGALIQVTASGPYTIHEMRAASGTTVREFVSPSGMVFGVAWQGPYVPDLRQVLGTYFDPYQRAAQAAQAKRSGHGPLLINDPNFVVEQRGHPRAFSGRAYVLQLMPSGVQPDIVQ